MMMMMKMKMMMMKKMMKKMMMKMMIVTMLIIRTESYTIKTEHGLTEVFHLPDEQTIRLLFWTEEVDTAINLTYIVSTFQYPSLELNVSERRRWLSAHFYYNRVYIPSAGVNKSPTPPSWWDRQVYVMSQEAVFWYLCRSPYQCSPGPPTQHDSESPPQPHLTLAPPASHLYKTVTGLSVLCGLLGLTTLALTIYVCYIFRRRTHQRSSSSNPGAVRYHLSGQRTADERADGNAVGKVRIGHMVDLVSPRSPS
ncbi:uncharacterized protein LOC121854986 [Homarus americanus]|uniref:uncharacterized protein LOC121854986 n=1 Tax=Homarus americanus TaxID=6706 RepID=UPI001C45C909|nr:uncharacterized protein LOC121854986 [Homarus americanus]